MSIAYWCVLIAAVMPVFLVGFAKRAGGGYNNSDPRNLDNLGSDRQRRAWAAHQNAFEAFPFFAVAVVVATTQNAGGSLLNDLAMGWVLMRVLHAACYIGDRASLRSLVFIVVWLLTIGIFTLPVWLTSLPLSTV